MSLTALALITLCQLGSPWTAEGVIKEVSSGPAGRSIAELRTADGKTVALLPRGELGAREPQSLATHKVRVFGERGDPAAPGGNYARVDRYEILDVGGKGAPRVGTLGLLQVEATPRLVFVDAAGRADLLPTGWTKKLRAHVGARIWMIGNGSGADFKPRRFGVLRLAKPDAQP